MTRGLPRRDRTLRRFRTLDLALGLGFALLLGGLCLSRALSFWQSYALTVLLLTPVFVWMSWRQYVLLDERLRGRLLLAYAASGTATLGSLLLLVAWCAWTAPHLGPADLVGLLSLVFLLGWGVSWGTWLGLRRGHG